MAHVAVKPSFTSEPGATCSCLERRCAKRMGGETYVGCGTGNSLGGAGRVLTSQPFAEAGGGMSVFGPHLSVLFSSFVTLLHSSLPLKRKK